VSYDIFFRRFAHGQPIPLDRTTLLAALKPFTVSIEPAFNFLRLRTPDGGEADVYGAVGDGPCMGFAFSRFSAGEISDLIVAVAITTDTVVLLPGCPALVTQSEQVQHLPEDFPTQAVVVSTGKDFETVLAAC
jgi:hypothetical protein